ncbi:anti-sigma regulatory factor (Ser/Thr protein kinase) [Pseudomonas sp. TE3786]
MDLNISSSLTLALQVDDDSQVGHARRVVQKLASDIGFDSNDAGRAALVTTELTSNLLKHAGRGELHVRVLPHGEVSGIELLAIDRGPGFNLHDCLADGFSTGGTQGIGMGAVDRQSDVFDVFADHRGAVLMARLYPRGSKVADVRFGVTQHSLHNDPACGDIWHLAMQDKHVSALVIDGLGHGPDAQDAAQAGEKAFAASPFSTPTFLIEDLHRAMCGTRGGAGAVAQYDAATGRLQFAGIGNIGATLVSMDKSRGLASHPGILGAQFRKAQTFDFPDCTGQLLVMYSDGLQSRWNLQDYPGLVSRHPAVIAAVLHRDFCRGRDDVTVLVVPLEAANG